MDLLRDESILVLLVYLPACWKMGKYENSMHRLVHWCAILALLRRVSYVILHHRANTILSFDKEESYGALHSRQAKSRTTMIKQTDVLSQPGPGTCLAMTQQSKSRRYRRILVRHCTMRD